MQVLTFRTFKEEAGAYELMMWLQEHGIPAEMDNTCKSADFYMGEGALAKEYVVRIPPPAFELAKDLLVSYFRQQLSKVPPDYYLFTFTDDELLDILKKPDEWGDLDYALAEELLNQRGIKPGISELASFKESRFDQLTHVADDGRKLLIRGYIFLFIIPLLTIGLGWQLANSTKTLPDGTRMYNYTREYQSKGRAMMWIAISLIAGLLLLRMKSMFHLSFE